MHVSVLENKNYVPDIPFKLLHVQISISSCWPNISKIITRKIRRKYIYVRNKIRKDIFQLKTQMCTMSSMLWIVNILFYKFTGRLIHYLKLDDTNKINNTRQNRVMEYEIHNICVGLWAAMVLRIAMVTLKRDGPRWRSLFNVLIAMV